ncbi:MAG: CBS domain-containing protein [Longimicrobiales bacterium]
MKAGDMLRRKRGAAVITTPAGTAVAEAAALLMEHGIGSLPVVGADGSLAGLVSERDVARAVAEHPDRVRDRPVKEVMQRPAPSCSYDESIYALMGRMTRDRLRHVVVVDDGQVLGVISVGDLVKHRMEELETEAGVLRDHVAALRARG